MTSKVSGEFDAVVVGPRHKNKSCSACRERVNERVWVCENVTFQHTHENKSCSACREWVNKRGKQWLNERLNDCESEKECEWDSESKFWAYTWKQKLFRTFKHSYIPGSQLVSDIQTFFPFLLKRKLKLMKNCNFISKWAKSDEFWI